MSLKAYRLHSITGNAVGFAHDSLTLDPGIEAFAEMGGAATLATVSGEKQAAPVVSGTTRDIKAFIDAFGLTGYALTGVSNSKMILYLAKLAAGSAVFASGSVHKKLTITKGLLCCETVQGKGNEPISINFKVYAEYDGTNAPLLLEDNVALPSTPARLADLWVTGPIDNGGTLIETQGGNLNIGPDVLSARKDGEVYPTLVAIRSYKMTFQADTLDAGALAANGSKTDVIWYLRKVNQNGAGRVADGTAEHIAITFAATYNHAGQGSLSGAQEGSFQHQWTIIYDGTNAAIAVDTTAAIA